ncbi:MAG: hypothetical protein ACREFR_00405 [Limisphaerales bacterium]
MNIRSAGLMQSGLQNAAENAMRNRELAQQGELARQNLAIMNAFRQAELERYTRMAERQEEFGEKSAANDQTREILGEQNLAREQQQNALAQKQAMLKTVLGLNATGQLTPSGLKSVNQWLSNDPDMSKTGMQLQAPGNPSDDPGHKSSALVAGIGMLQQLRQQASAATDPAEKAQLGRYADDLEGAIRHGRPNETDTTTDASGKVLRRTTRNFALPAGARADSDGDGDETPAMPASVPDNGNLWQRLTGAPVTVPAGFETAAPVNLTAQDMTPVHAYPTPPATHVAYLQANPTPKVMSDFDALYGPGASQQALKPIPGGGGFPIVVPQSTPPAVASQ